MRCRQMAAVLPVVRAPAAAAAAAASQAPSRSSGIKRARAPVIERTRRLKHRGKHLREALADGINTSVREKELRMNKRRCLVGPVTRSEWHSMADERVRWFRYSDAERREGRMSHDQVFAGPPALDPAGFVTVALTAST
jgi:hypothetical protein